MCWVLLIMFLVCVLVGGLAQAWKRRVGALWGLITLLMEALAFLVLYVGLPARRAWVWRSLEQGWRARVFGVRGVLPGVIAALGVGLVMSLVVATLPMARRGSQSGGDEEP